MLGSIDVDQSVNRSGGISFLFKLFSLFDPAQSRISTFRDLIPKIGSNVSRLRRREAAVLTNRIPMGRTATHHPVLQDKYPSPSRRDLQTKPAHFIVPN